MSHGVNWSMTFLFQSLVAVGMLPIIGVLGGCGSRPSQSPPSQVPAAASGENEQHAHDHDHSHDGPHGGHLVELGDEQYHAEWTHDDQTGRITVFILDAAAQEDVAIDAETITIEAQIKEKAAQTYALQAVRASDQESPKASQFEIVDHGLLTTLQVVGEGAEASLKVTIDGQEFTGKFEHHEHEHHH